MSSKGVLLVLVTDLILIVLTQCNSNKKYNSGQENAIWVESSFFRGYHPVDSSRLSDDEIIEFAQTLKKHKIKYAYIFSGPFNKDGFLPKYSFSDTAIKSVKMLKKIYPEIKILPWIGGIQNKTVFLNDSGWVRHALFDSKKLIKTLSVPGLHFDFEFVLQGDPFFNRMGIKEEPGDSISYGDNVNEFHRKFRELMPDAFISSVVVATSPGTRPWKRKTSLNELKVLIKYINQISFLYFDTGINNQPEFEKNCTYLIKDIQSLKHTECFPEVHYLIAIGTFINEPELQKYRNMDIESIPNTLNTLKTCLSVMNPKERIVDGISIYCNWQTDEDEWRQIYDNWAK